MTKTIALAGILFLLASCNSHPSAQGCERFKVGEFRISLKSNGHEFKIVRNDVNQIETDPAAGITSTYKIKWLNPCEYQITLLSRKVAEPDTFHFSPIGTTLTTQIISTSTNYYVFESHMSGISWVYSDTMWLTKSR